MNKGEERGQGEDGGVRKRYAGRRDSVSRWCEEEGKWWNAIGNELVRGTGKGRRNNDITSSCAGGKGGREFGAVDRALNLKGLLTRARSEAGRGPAVSPRRWVQERERERRCRERTTTHYYTQQPTPPEFRNSGAQTLCFTNNESSNLLRVERNCSNTWI